MTAAERNIGNKHMTDIPNSRRSPMEHERDMPDAQTDAPNIARVAYDKYLASWGDEPSIAPHPRTSPGYTTGRVLIDIHNAADALDAAQAEIAKLRSALAELMGLMDAVCDGDYTPDSFTTQPARAALAQDAIE
jgi:hypothetical protein